MTHLWTAPKCCFQAGYEPSRYEGGRCTELSVSTLSLEWLQSSRWRQCSFQSPFSFLGWLKCTRRTGGQQKSHLDFNAKDRETAKFPSAMDSKQGGQRVPTYLFSTSTCQTHVLLAHLTFASPYPELQKYSFTAGCYNNVEPCCSARIVLKGYNDLWNAKQDSALSRPE
jgi:hypothetical protein